MYKRFRKLSFSSREKYVAPKLIEQHNLFNEDEGQI